MIAINEIISDKTKFMELLLIGDEQEEMIAKYLDRGRLFVMKNDETVCAACVVTDEGNRILELKNIAVYPEFQRQGLGKRLILYIEERFCSSFSRLILGTGDSPLTVPFYEKCGFVPVFYKNSYLIYHDDNEDIFFDPFTGAVDYRSAKNYS